MEDVKILPIKYPLSKRQHDVCVLLAKGLPHKQIAKELKISTHTVEQHIADARMKLGAINAPNLVALLFIYYPKEATKLYRQLTKASERMQRRPRGASDYTWS